MAHHAPLPHKKTHLSMALGIMRLNMRKLRCLPKRRDVPIQIPQPLMQMRETAPDVAVVGLEMLHVHGVEAHDRGVQPHIGLSDVGAKVERPRGRGEVRFGAVEGGEEGNYGFGVGFFCGGEAGAVDAVVDVGVRPVVRGFDFLLEVLGVENYVLVFLGQDIVELPASTSVQKPLRKGGKPPYKTSL
jgi:hypothetical protein